MNQEQTPRKYDLILFGATGYTGGLCAQKILELSPSNLRWCIAGRSPHKLELLQHDFHRRYPDRTPVDTFICDLSEHSIEKMASLTRLLVTTVGPFINHGTPVLEACAVWGTHYVDSTGEYSWVYEMVKKCHRTAVKHGAIMVPQCGFDSCPMDLGTLKLVQQVRESTGCPVRDCTIALTDKSISVSGGTYETVLNIFDAQTLQELTEASAHDALSPVKPGPPQPWSWPIVRHPQLGLLTSWLNYMTDRAQVFRTWGLLDKGEYYGKNFVWSEKQRVGNIVSALLWAFLINAFKVAFIFSPVRWIARKTRRFAPGEGHSEEERKKNHASWEGIAVADESSPNPRKAHLRASGPDPYEQTAIYMIISALAILNDENIPARKMGGGILTPACLATPEYFQQLEKAGIRFETKMLEE